MGTRAWIATLFFIPLILCAGCGKADDSDTVAASIHQVLAGKARASLAVRTDPADEIGHGRVNTLMNGPRRVDTSISATLTSWTRNGARPTEIAR